MFKNIFFTEVLIPRENAPSMLRPWGEPQSCMITPSPRLQKSYSIRIVYISGHDCIENRWASTNSASRVLLELLNGVHLIELFQEGFVGSSVSASLIVPFTVVKNKVPCNGNRILQIHSTL